MVVVVIEGVEVVGVEVVRVGILLKKSYRILGFVVVCFPRISSLTLLISVVSKLSGCFFTLNIL